jgi:hypothetical protein
VCAADKTGLKCDLDLAANIDGGALVGFVQDAAIRGVGTKIKDCIKLALNAVGTAGAEKYAPTQGQLDTCHGLAKAAYKIAKGVVQLLDQEWERTKRDAMHVQVQTFLDSCNKNVETLTTGATAKTAAYKDCHVEKDRIVSFVEGRPFTFPCGPGVTISSVQTFFPNVDGTGKLIKMIQCDATATANEIFNKGADAAADLINVVGDAAGDARSNCMVTVRAAFTTETNIQKAALAKPCHDAAKAAIATAQGVDLSLISEADVERAIDSGAVKGAATAVTNCMEGVAASITTTTDLEKKAAQKACVTGSAKNALIDSLGLVDATELKDSMLNRYVEEAAKGNMIDAVKVCVGAIADADTGKAAKQEACRTTTAKEAYMKAKGMRGNTMKSMPRWSERVYVIDRRRGGGAAPYAYRLEGRPKKDVYARELLQVVKGDLPPPPEASAERDEYDIARVLRVQGGNALVVYSGWPDAEWTPIGNVPANLLPA